MKTGGWKQMENVRVKRNEERVGKLWDNIKRASIQERPENAKAVDTLHKGIVLESFPALEKGSSIQGEKGQMAPIKFSSTLLTLLL